MIIVKSFRTVPDEREVKRGSRAREKGGKMEREKRKIENESIAKQNARGKKKKSNKSLRDL
jgi:hypothetical protein